MRAAVVLALAWIGSACSGGADAPVPTGAAAATPPAAPQHGETCADCHEHIVTAWNQTPMAAALGWTDPSELEGLQPVTDAAGFTYRFEVEGDRGYLVETPPAGGPESPGQPARAPLTLAIGAGKLDRSYAVVHGQLQWFAPLERLSATPHVPAHAALAPANEVTPGARASVPITPECLGCHTDSAPPTTWPLNVSVQHAVEAGVWTPSGISCAACHGDVDAHAAWQEDDLAGLAPTSADDPVLQHASMGRYEQISVCAACHLQGDVRIVLTQGELGPPPPGGDLLESRVLFVAREPSNDVGFVSQVERMMLSPCFLESEMTCTTCHDPHRAVDAPGERERTRNTCLGCHRDVTPEHSGDAEPADRDAADCVGCHMPRRPAFDLAEIEIHDHWIRAAPDPASEPGPLRTAESPDARWKRATWPGAPKPSHHDSPGFLMMALTKNGHIERALDLVDVAPGPGARDLSLYHHVRANLLEMAGRPEHARLAYEQALALDPEYPPAITNLGLLEGTLGEPKAGIARLDRLIERHPLAASALRNRSILRKQTGDIAGTIADLERALAIQPDASVASALAKLHGATGNRERAAEMAAEAKRLDPRR